MLPVIVPVFILGKVNFKDVRVTDSGGPPRFRSTFCSLQTNHIASYC